jgi:uncharacterized protein (DUF1697 family)
MKYAAFLRGINVGGNKKIPMADLKKCLEKLGFKQVKTILNSGNATFEAEKTKPEVLRKKIEAQLKKNFGFEVSTIIRSMDDLQKLADLNPFKGIRVSPATRLYITFLSDTPSTTLKIPYTSLDKNFKILRSSDTEVCSVLVVTPDRGSVDAMGILEKEYGKNVTTRNWNTVVKISFL